MGGQVLVNPRCTHRLRKPRLPVTVEVGKAYLLRDDTSSSQYTAPGRSAPSQHSSHYMSAPCQRLFQAISRSVAIETHEVRCETREFADASATRAFLRDR